MSYSVAPNEWFGWIRRLESRLAAGQSDLESALRHAFHLLQLAPGPLADMFGIDISEQRFEEWLDDEAWEEAARAIVADHLPIAVSVPDGHATVKIDGLWFDASAECSASTVAMATLRAWLGCVIDVQDKAAAEFFIHPDPHLTGFRSALHQQSTEH